jgi:uncharacterized repeat protein (TIGR03803 family)
MQPSYKRSGLRRRRASAALALVVVALPVIVATQPTQAQTFSVIHSFTGPPDGGHPIAGLVQDEVGNLYGTTFYGGTFDSGTVFKIDTSSKETVLYSFTGGADGAFPFGGVTLDAAGNLYGTCVGGSGNGVVFKLDNTGKETVLHTFTGGTDGQTARGGLVRDTAGNLYGITQGGGTSGQGVVFKVDPAGNETILHNFAGTDGNGPFGILARDAAGNLYGTTTSGGAFGNGVVFKVDPAGNETVLHSFAGAPDGASPQAGLVLDAAAGILYGTTTGGGATNNGVVFKLDPTGTETVLHSFTGTDGSAPIAALVLDAAGNLYGTTDSGGTGSCFTFGCGVVFKLDTTLKETVLYNFTGGADGAQPLDLLLDSSGNLYGITLEGGVSGCHVFFTLDCGVAFKITPASDFSLTPASASLIVQNGGKVTDIITIAPQNGSFGHAVQLSCAVAGPPPVPTCALSLTSVTPGTSSVTSDLTITAPEALSLLTPSSKHHPRAWIYAMWLPLAVLGMMLIAGSKPKPRRYWLLCSLFPLVFLLQSACAGGGSIGGVKQGQNYTVTVTGNAMAEAIEHTTQVTLTVN